MPIFISKRGSGRFVLGETQSIGHGFRDVSVPSKELKSNMGLQHSRLFAQRQYDAEHGQEGGDDRNGDAQSFLVVQNKLNLMAICMLCPPSAEKFAAQEILSQALPLALRALAIGHKVATCHLSHIAAGVLRALSASSPCRIRRLPSVQSAGAGDDKLAASRSWGLFLCLVTPTIHAFGGGLGTKSCSGSDMPPALP